MDAFTPAFTLGAIQFFWLLAVTLTMWLRKPGADAATAVALMQQAITRQDQYNATAMSELRAKNDLLEERVKHLPTHGDIRALVDDVADMKGQVTAVSEGQHRQQRVLERIEDWLNGQRNK